jgi:hypothetical protein
VDVGNSGVALNPLEFCALDAGRLRHPARIAAMVEKQWHGWAYETNGPFGLSPVRGRRGGLLRVIRRFIRVSRAESGGRDTQLVMNLFHSGHRFDHHFGQVFDGPAFDPADESDVAVADCDFDVGGIDTRMLG